MTTYIIEESEIESYYHSVIESSESIEESKIKAGLLGLRSFDSIEEAKKNLKIGDCILLEYDGKLLPFQCIHRRKNGNVVLSSYYVLDNHIFDEKTNVWRDSSIRKYMNEEMAKKFDPELLKCVKTTEVHTDNYVTKDKFWLLSHEEIGYDDESGMFRKNVGSEVFDYYKKK